MEGGALRGRRLRIPVVGFYHSHFPEAYVRTARKYCGETVTELFMDFSRRYIRSLYNRFARTLVPSPALGELLAAWGVRQSRPHRSRGGHGRLPPAPAPGEDVRAEFGIPRDRTLLLYVGRLAQEKNTQTLFAAFRLLASEASRGASTCSSSAMAFSSANSENSLRRRDWQNCVERQAPVPLSLVTHASYCAEAPRLAALYRAADLFVHPGVQETFGLVTLEAQACGTPVIGIRGSYMDRIIHSDQTLWARENSPAALAAAIEETSREDLKASGARASRRVSAQYSWTQVFTRLV